MIESPKKIKEYFEQQTEFVKEADLFSSPKLSWLLDVWIAGHFGELFEKYIAPCKVEVDESDSQKYYDFKLHLKEDVIPFQATEVLESERKRGAEYKRGESLFEQSYWRGSNIEPYEYVGRTIESKLEKYGVGASDINLVIYANLFGFSEGFDDVYDQCKRAITQFKSVWLFSSSVFGALYEKEPGHYRLNNWIKING